jgi:AraC-like DNA-binding protein
VPDGLADLLVSVSLESPGDVVELAVYGIKTRPIVVESATRVENIAVRLRAGAVATLLGIAAHELTDRAVPLADLWGDRAAELASQIARTRGFDARRALLERALQERPDSGLEAEATLAAEAALAIEASGGRVRVAELALRLDAGERRLQRAFRRHVGLAPKTYARIVRFRQTWEALGQGERQSRVAAAHGYSDQAHLLRDFRRFAGTSPRRVGFVQSPRPNTA